MFSVHQCASTHIQSFYSWFGNVEAYKNYNNLSISYFAQFMTKKQIVIIMGLYFWNLSETDLKITSWYKVMYVSWYGNSKRDAYLENYVFINLNNCGCIIYSGII